jgi:hypothetical protein
MVLTELVMGLVNVWTACVVVGLMESRFQIAPVVVDLVPKRRMMSWRVMVTQWFVNTALHL